MVFADKLIKTSAQAFVNIRQLFSSFSSTIPRPSLQTVFGYSWCCLSPIMIDGSFNLWAFLGFYLQATLSSSSVSNLDELMSLPSIQRDWLRAEQGWVNQIQLLSRLFWTFTKNLIKKVDQSRVVDKWTLESKVWTRGTKNWWNITERKLGAKTTYWQVQLFTQHPLLVVWPALWDIAPREKMQSLEA